VEPDPFEDEEDRVEIGEPPSFAHGERVVCRFNVRNDGTFPGKEIGDPLVGRGEIGYVASIGTFLQRYYIYAVDFVDSGHRVGMRSRELVSIDRLPPRVLERLGPRAAELERLGRPERDHA